MGDFGLEAHRFARELAGMEQSWWQMLPIGPTGYGDSPYQSPSTFAGNPLLIGIDLLVEEGLLDPAAAQPATFPADVVDFGSVIDWRMGRLLEVSNRFHGSHLRTEFEGFRRREADVWLADFALFTALKRANHHKPWWEWDEDLAGRDQVALRYARRRLDQEITAIEIEQFLFERHFRRLREACSANGVRLIGDIPIFVAHDSADVWANRHLYHLDRAGMPTEVAGVPPDYFSTTGQRWGNPLYRWEVHRQSGFEWWTNRLQRAFSLFDLVRIDHFRGFVSSWHIPASESTAVKGRWVPAPGEELFDHLHKVFGELPVIAEDLGLITADVVALRDRYRFPGMKILQFGFGTESHHSPDQFTERVVAYTGTHDNDTAMGWFADQSADRVPERRLAIATLGKSEDEFNWALIAGVMESVADTAVIPLQDVLGLGTAARMNTPGTTAGNWQWRFQWDQLSPERRNHLIELTRRSGRSPVSVR